MMSLLILWLGILYVSSENGYKIIWTFDSQLSNYEKDIIQLLISRLLLKLPKTLDC